MKFYKFYKLQVNRESLVMWCCPPATWQRGNHLCRKSIHHDAQRAVVSTQKAHHYLKPMMLCICEKWDTKKKAV